MKEFMTDSYLEDIRKKIPGKKKCCSVVKNGKIQSIDIKSFHKLK